jgi:hypothetical protein
MAEWHDRYVRTICENPLYLLGLAVLYIGAILFMGSACIAAALALQWWLYPDVREPAWNIQLSFAGIALVLAVAVAGHFLYISIRCFAAPPQRDRFRYPVFRVVQLVATTVVLFAVIHYYVALFSTKPAYSTGLKIPEPPGGWQPYQSWLDRLIFWPPFESVLDCFYFSTVTMATVGYGDMYPVSVPAKIVTIAEIFSSFTLIVVVLGSVMGDSRKSPPAGDDLS